jgi:hypothetical protein
LAWAANHPHTTQRDFGFSDGFYIHRLPVSE